MKGHIYAHADRDENVYIHDNQDHGQQDYDAGKHLDYDGHASEDQDGYGPDPHYEDDSHYNEQQYHGYQDEN